MRRIEMTERETPVFGGAEFGTAGTYERLHRTVFGELDPTHLLNAGIVNLDRAPRNARGNFEYQSDFRILKPLDLERGNGCLVYDLPNRGSQPIMPRLNGAPEGGHPQHAGNGFLMRRGFTLVWSGRQGDVPRKAPVVSAVRNGRITLEEALLRDQPTEEEYRAWERGFEQYGVPGLRSTRLQQYRGRRGPRSRR